MAELFLERDEGARGPLAQLVFWDLVACLGPIKWLPHWVEGYQELTAEHALACDSLESRRGLLSYGLCPTPVLPVLEGAPRCDHRALVRAGRFIRRAPLSGQRRGQSLEDVPRSREEEATAVTAAYDPLVFGPVPVAIFDMDGVLYRGSMLMPHARETLERLRRGGWQVFFATNNSSATREEYVQRLGTFGLGGDSEHIVTSAYATAHYLERLDPRPRDVYVVGADGLRAEIRVTGIPVREASSVPGIEPSARLPPTADTVVVGLDVHVNYAKIAEAQRCVLAGARFICSNRDRAYPVEGRLLPGAGTIVAAIEVATGATAICIGKPEPFLFEEILRRAGERQAVVIGDSTDYDIVAAHRVGAVGVLILTGLEEKTAIEHARGQAVPDRVVASLNELFDLPEFAGL